MAEYPILMSGEMIRAFRDGRKTQTRRPVTVRGLTDLGRPYRYADRWAALSASAGVFPLRCPFGAAGDRIWFRETWALNFGYRNCVAYRADYRDAREVVAGPANWDGEPAVDVARWRPSIHMPRWAARFTPLVKRVWVERVQDITPEGALAEGIRAVTKDGTLTKFCVYDLGDHSSTPWASMRRDPREAFADLWDSIYAARGLGWADNPWVWCCEFERCSEAGGR